MGFFQRLFYIKEHPSIIELNRVLDELGKELASTKIPLQTISAYQELIRPDIENLVAKNKQQFCDLHDKNTSNIKMWVYITANNKAGDLLETGRYNMRNILYAQGEGLLQIFETTIRGLVNMGIKNDDGTPADMSFADERIADLKDILAHMG